MLGGVSLSLPLNSHQHNPNIFIMGTRGGGLEWVGPTRNQDIRNTYYIVKVIYVLNKRDARSV